MRRRIPRVVRGIVDAPRGFLHVALRVDFELRAGERAAQHLALDAFGQSTVAGAASTEARDGRETGTGPAPESVAGAEASRGGGWRPQGWRVGSGA